MKKMLQVMGTVLLGLLLTTCQLAGPSESGSAKEAEAAVKGDPLLKNPAPGEVGLPPEATVPVMPARPIASLQAMSEAAG
jgi:hypothetical protein